MYLNPNHKYNCVCVFVSVFPITKHNSQLIEIKKIPENINAAESYLF